MNDILILVFNHSHCVVAINGTLQYNYHLLTSHTTVMYKNKLRQNLCHDNIQFLLGA